MKRALYLIMSIISGVIAIIGFISMLEGCFVPNNLGGSYTRLYPVTSYEIGSERFTATYTLEDGRKGHIEAQNTNLYFYEGEDTLIVISSDEYGKGLDGVKRFYLYLNSEKAKESLGTMIDSMVENGG